MTQPLSSSPHYYSNVRRETLHALPDHVGRILEIGCGEGATGGYLRAEGRCDWAGGVELMPEIAERARQRLDQVWDGDFERIEPDIAPQSIDVILCLDVLEHMVDPWTAVRRLHEWLKPGGCIVASIPNVRYSRVVFPLLFRGKWTYRDAGVLDRTHLRFFVRETAIELMECSGLKVDLVERLNADIRRWTFKWFLDIATRGLVKEFRTPQFLIRAVRTA